MNILALDLTSPFGSLVVWKNGATIAERTVDSTDGFGHLLYGTIRDLLSDAGLHLHEIDCFASANGPGAFTGIRVGLAAAKGMAEVLDRPVSGVSNLRALSTFGTAELRGVILDARRGDIYAAVYNREAELISQEIVSKQAPWLASLRLNVEEWLAQDPDLIAGSGLEVTLAPKYLASAVAACAAMDGKRGRWTDPAALDANYVRRSDAELFLKEI